MHTKTFRTKRESISNSTVIEVPTWHVLHQTQRKEHCLRRYKGGAGKGWGARDF